MECQKSQLRIAENRSPHHFQKVAGGELSEKDLAGLLKKLPDVSENAEEIVAPSNEK